MEPASSISLASTTSSVRRDAPDLKGPTAVQPSGRVRSDSVHIPNRERPVAKNSAPPEELPKDEVHVQRDAKNDGKIVIQYVDHSGHLILQVPSKQLLALQHAVAEALGNK